MVKTWGRTKSREGQGTDLPFDQQGKAFALTFNPYQESPWKNLECMKRTMSPKGWCHSVLVVQAGAVFLVLGPVGELVQQAEAVVAYSTQNQPSIYLEELTNQKLESFSELWQGIFLWGFFSILFIHIVSAIIAFLMLRRHKYGRYSAACVLLFGMCTTFVMCVATSAAVGFVLYQAKITLQPIEAMTCGIAQTVLLILFSFSKVMPTL